jgi:hypothetical protein
MQAKMIWFSSRQKKRCTDRNLSHKPYGLTINMGGDDVSVAAIIYKKL